MKSTVLLIDDDPIDVKPIRALLESWDMDVITARSGKSGIDLIKSRPVDMVLSDLRMPGMTGMDVVQAVSKDFPGLPVVLITGKADVKSAVNAMKLGAFDYLTKPPDETELLAVIEKAIEHSRLLKENRFLRAELAAGGMYGERIIGRSPAMLEVYDIVRRVAATDSTVLITGETGTGKELVAQNIHYRSRRSANPFIAVNCASLNPNLIESELFGHEKGAFTGAQAARRGRFEDADGGTLFLDEIAETETEFQAKLLRVLQEGEFERVGGNRKIKVDTRILASTNKDIQELAENGGFREDLYYRLCVIPVHLPPLRERPGDIRLLASHFAGLYADQYGCRASGISEKGLEYLAQQEWKGNVRELQHAIERAMVLSSGDMLDPEDFKSRRSGEEPGLESTLDGFLSQKTKEHLIRTLDRTGWRKKEAAKILGIDRATLYRMLKKYSISR